MISAIAATMIAYSHPDLGSPADVAAVRSAERRAAPSVHIDNIRVVGRYSMVRWFEGEAAGVALLKRMSGGRWKQLDSTGGMYDVGTLIHQFGVPAAVARKLLEGANTY